MTKSRALGKGLGALLPGGMNDVESNRDFFLCPLDQISPNPFQPRKEMKGKELEQLSNSIKENGIIQPLVVREKTDGTGYELVAGERRLRAAKMAGFEEVPVLIKNVSELDSLQLAIIENIQRENLNPVDEAEAYSRLIEEFGLTQEQVSMQVGKERSTVANVLRILQLPDFAKKDVSEGRLSAGHARVLLSLDSLDEMQDLRDQIISQSLSVRQAEAIAKKSKKQKKNVSGRTTQKKASESIPESYCKALSNDLIRYLGTKCRIVQNGSRGKLEMEYYSLDDLERLIELVIRRQ